MSLSSHHSLQRAAPQPHRSRRFQAAGRGDPSTAREHESTATAHVLQNEPGQQRCPDQGNDSNETRSVSSQMGLWRNTRKQVYSQFQCELRADPFMTNGIRCDRPAIQAAGWLPGNMAILGLTAGLLLLEHRAPRAAVVRLCLVTRQTLRLHRRGKVERR